MAMAIAGGGIAGLAGAIALARAGRVVVVFEQSADFSEAGAGVQIGPNGMRALQRLGAWEALAPLTVEPRRILLSDGLSGRILNEIDLGRKFSDRYGASYRVAHRGDLLAALLATARAHPGIEFKTGIAVKGFDFSHHWVIVHLDPGGAFEAEALIGADGLHSAVRARLYGDTAPDYAGHVLYRALVPIDAVPESVQTDCVALWLYPRGHVVHYPVSGGAMMNIVAACEAASGDVGWGAPAAAAEVSACLPHAVPPLAAILEAARDWRQWPAADRPSAGRRGEGPVTLIGDAAHAVLPYLAQGAMMALEDAVVLAHCLGSGPALADGFRAYERQRRPRIARLAQMSRRQGRIYHLRDPLRLARNAVLSAMPSKLFLDRLDWLYSWQPPDVTQ